jgi:hypothetical protein
VISAEHGQAALFPPGQIGALPMPPGYKNSIATWLGP